ncbi:glycosyltransferase family 87 protein [Roseibacterium sp. SDUM158017]|uniref:glycosyltransferase family 87 protein n=1 Tax=Roseicyclus salinarum TaxID=3036773 RepID=UPI002415376B|nr:glycosyltransferase family 87 protein [Roseibacterium sp. SDUM158017]MDG4647567.1 glycosyltransferase family 87 protein [Roseibacterium sp. SDUM158017]
MSATEPPGAMPSPGFLDSRAAARTGAFVALLTLFLLWFWASVVWTILATSDALVLNVDFRVFWGAARLAVMGDALAALDPVRLAEIHDDTRNPWLPWVYPPGLLLAIYPLGLVDYLTAWLAFIGVSLAAILGAVRLLAGSLRPVWLAFALSPAILPALVLGQVSVLWAAGLVAALACLRDGRVVAAGILLGLLTFKPQLGPLVALALVASGRWRVVAVAAATAVAFHGAATLVFGAAYWPAFLDLAGQHAERLRSDVADAELMVSPYSALTAIGLPEPAAFALQWTLSAAAAAAVWRAWSMRGLGFDARAAVLVCAIPLASPYLWYAETALLAPALMFLMRAGLVRVTLPGVILAALMAAGTTPYLMARLLVEGGDLPMRLFAAPVLLAAFLVAVSPLIRHLGTRTSRP